MLLLPYTHFKLLFIISICLLHTFCLGNNNGGEISNSFYEILGVKSEASRLEIRNAYKSLVTKWHPDRNKLNDDTKFTLIQKAYEVLSNNERRQLYDFYQDQHEEMFNYFNNIIKPNNIEELYSFSPDITILFDKNFNNFVIGANQQWIVQFYSPSCQPCVEKVALVKSLARAARDSSMQKHEENQIKIGVVNCLASHFLCTRFHLNYLGQFVIFEPEQENIGDWDFQLYEGPLTISNILNTARGIKKSKILEVKNISDFKDMLKNQNNYLMPNINTKRIAIIQYFSPGCYHCRVLKKELKAISTKFSNLISLAYIDCSQNLCSVPYFPYLKLLVERRGENTFEEHTIDFSMDAHPGYLAVYMMGFIMERLFGDIRDMYESNNYDEL